MQLTITHQGTKGLQTIGYIYCTIFQKDRIPALLKKCKDKLPENPEINNLMVNWDIVNISSDLLDLLDCFIQDERHINAAPNGRGPQNMPHPIQNHCVYPLIKPLIMQAYNFTNL